MPVSSNKKEPEIIAQKKQQTPVFFCKLAAVLMYIQKNIPFTEVK